MTRLKAIFCWSGGKDSALALHRTLIGNEFEVVCLLTTINEHFKRVSMHGVREELVEQQAASIGIPLEKMYVPEKTNNEEYGLRMEKILMRYKDQRVTHVIFGDIFLEDLRKWREQNISKVGMTAVFPLWKLDTQALVQEFNKLGFESILCCVNDAYLNESFVGAKIGSDFIQKLPSQVDPCGENGEYHSFVFAGPLFKKPILFRVGEKVYRPIDAFQNSSSTNVCSLQKEDEKPKTKGFWFCDLLPEKLPTCS